jgi:hypothetical protein
MATSVPDSQTATRPDETASVLARFTPAAATLEQYDETIRRLQGAGEWPPDGLAYHVAFASGGSLRVSEIWDSREQFKAFGKRLMPVLDEVGIDPGEPEMLDIHNIIQR